MAADVATSRLRLHHLTGDLSTDNLLRGIGPSLWSCTHATYKFPDYNTMKTLGTTVHSVHSGGAAYSVMNSERVDKSLHVKRDGLAAHAQKIMELGEAPFRSGGMKPSSH